MKLQVGIFFGGSSRAREQSFASAKNIFQHLDQRLFEPVPIFVDIHNRLYLLPSESFQQNNIRSLLGLAYSQIDPSFHLEQESYQAFEHQDISEVFGRELVFSELPQMINLALLCAENNQEGVEPLLQALLDKRIPFIGASISSIAGYHSRSSFKDRVQALGIHTAPYSRLSYEAWQTNSLEDILSDLRAQLNGSVRLSPDFAISAFASSKTSLDADPAILKENINRAFFCEEIPLGVWQQKSSFQRRDHVQFLGDLQEGLAYPIQVKIADQEEQFDAPQSLLSFLEEGTEQSTADQIIYLQSTLSRSDVLIEEQIAGIPFSCTVIRNELGKGIALYPVIPLQGMENNAALTQLQLQLIQVQTIQVFEQLELSPCATFNGIFTKDDRVFINECWINPDLSVSSQLSQQLLKLNWSTSDFLTCFILVSLRQRIHEYPAQKTFPAILEHLQSLEKTSREEDQKQVKVTLLVAGDQEMDPIAWQVAQYAREQLGASSLLQLSLYTILSTKAPFRLKRLPLHELDQEPQKANQLKPPLLLEVEERLSKTMKAQGFLNLEIGEQYYDLNRLDTDFLLLCSSGIFQDGRFHKAAQEHQIPINGANGEILANLYDRTQVLKRLAQNGLKVVKQVLVKKSAFMSDIPSLIAQVEAQVDYPMTVHTGDHDYANLKLRINDQSELLAYAKLLFRPQGTMAQTSRDLLRIEPGQFLPVKDHFVLEPLGYLLSPRYIPFRSSILSVKEENTASYQQLGLEVNINGKWSFLNGENPQEELAPAVLAKIIGDLEKAVGVLNLQSYAGIEGYLRIFGDDNVELIFTNIDALPFLVSESTLFKHALAVGYNPIEIFEHIISFGLNRNLPLLKTTSEPIMVNEEDFNEDSSLESEEPQEEQPIETETTTETVEEQELNFFQRTWQEIKSLMQAPIFWKNLGAIVAAGLILFFTVVFILNRYTYHGKSYIVEDYVGMDFDEAKRKAKGKTFRATIIDSIFIIGEEPNIVKEQDPQPGSKVKKKRTIYMWVTGGQAPEILLPALAGKDDFETYRRELERRGIKLVIKERRFDRKLEPNTLMGFYYKGKSISPREVDNGFKVIKGSTLEAIISERTSDEVPIPNLVCQTFEDAKFQIEGNKLTLGEIYGTRNNSSYVWKQEPPFVEGQQIKTGTVIKLHLSTEKPDGCE